MKSFKDYTLLREKRKLRKTKKIHKKNFVKGIYGLPVLGYGYTGYGPMNNDVGSVDVGDGGGGE